MTSKIARNLIVAIILTGFTILPTAIAFEGTVYLNIGEYYVFEYDLNSGDSIDFEYEVLTNGADIDIYIFDSDNYKNFEDGNTAYYLSFIDDDVYGSLTFEPDESGKYYIILYNDAIFTNKAIYISYTVHRPILLIVVGIVLLVGVIILVKVTSKKKKAQTKTPEQSQMPNIAEIPNTSPMTQFCSGCGQPILDRGNFCKNCGNKI